MYIRWGLLAGIGVGGGWVGLVWVGIGGGKLGEQRVGINVYGLHVHGLAIGERAKLRHDGGACVFAAGYRLNFAALGERCDLGDSAEHLSRLGDLSRIAVWVNEHLH